MRLLHLLHESQAGLNAESEGTLQYSAPEGEDLSSVFGGRLARIKSGIVARSYPSGTDVRFMCRMQLVPDTSSGYPLDLLCNCQDSHSYMPPEVTQEVQKWRDHPKCKHEEPED